LESLLKRPIKQPINKGLKQGPACRWVRKIGWYSAAVRTDLDGAADKRRAGACCGACNLVSDSEPDYGHGRISDGSGILFGKKDIADSAGRRQWPKRKQFWAVGANSFIRKMHQVRHIY
jgi:hypothetical protein